MSKTKNDKFLNSPEILTRDPKSGLDVSAYGEDRGPIRREVIESRENVKGYGISLTRRAKDWLDKQFEKGEMSDSAYHAARDFQNKYSAAGHDRIATTNLTGSGGGMDKEDIMTRAADARDWVEMVKARLGGVDNPMWLALVWIVGEGRSARSLGDEHGKDHRYWMGVLDSALHILSDVWARRAYGRTKPRRMRGQSKGVDKC